MPSDDDSSEAEDRSEPEEEEVESEDEDEEQGEQGDQGDSDEASTILCTINQIKQARVLFCNVRQPAQAWSHFVRCCARAEQESDDDDARKKKAKTTSTAKSSSKATDSSVPESIPTKITLKGQDGTEFVFGRSIKMRAKPVPRAFDVEYRLMQPAGAGCLPLPTSRQFTCRTRV